MLEGLDFTAKEELDRIMQNRDKWSLICFSKVYTAGLHSNERASYVEGFVRSHYKYEHTMMDQIDCIKKLQQRECSLEVNSKEAHSYFTHPLYRGLKDQFSQYAVSMMLHQLIESYKYIAVGTNKDNVFHVRTDKGQTFTLVRENEPKKIFCGCSFYHLNEMVCAHSFCLMNAMQIKNLTYFTYLTKWKDDINPDDPSCREMIPKAR